MVRTFFFLHIFYMQLNKHVYFFDDHYQEVNIYCPEVAYFVKCLKLCWIRVYIAIWSSYLDFQRLTTLKIYCNLL